MSFRVALDELLEAVDRMAAFGTAIDEAVEDADGQVGRLHATWSGNAADAQRAAHARWRAGTRDMHAALAQLRSIANTAHENYSSAASTNARMWAGL